MQELQVLLEAIRRRWFARELASTLGRAAAVGAVPLFAAAAAVRLVRPGPGAVAAMVVVALAAAMAAALIVVRRMPRRPTDSQVARFVEEQVSCAEGPTACDPDSLVSAVRVLENPDGNTGRFAGPIVARATAVLRAIEPGNVVPSDSLRRGFRNAALGGAVLVIAVAMLAPSLQRAGALAWITLFAGSIRVSVATGDARVRGGQPLTISARLEGRGAHLLSVGPELVVSSAGESHTVPLARTADGSFAYRFESVDRSFSYKVVAGRAASQAYQVTALFPPRVTRIDLRYDYPAFSGLAPRIEEDGGDVYGPPGTGVHLTVHVDKPIASGALAFAGGAPVPLVLEDGRVEADFVLARDDAYRVTLKDVDGIGAPGEVEYFVRLMDDRPPGVQIVRPSSDQSITPLEEVAIEARADDDHGVARFDLVYAVAGRAPAVVPFTRVTGTGLEKAGAHVLAAEELRVQPGDVITYYARARDVGRGKRPTESRSDIFFLDVKPFNEEFVSAESQGMAGTGSGTPLDSLIAAQKEVITATWNLERRAGAGRSAADIEAVNLAQAELKTRLERMTAGGRGRGSGMFPPQQVSQSAQPSRASGSDHVDRAVQAMGRAIEQLGAKQTAGALPHEMAALQALLQAQAEVRRRQVMQQSASAAGQGGSSRSDRDLSSLFDRELQRQQRTNYENQQQSTEAPPPAERSDALERVRDLARRQEAIARRQRELAEGGASAEERARQLERLTREQEELRQQADALERQLRAEQGKGQGGRGQSQGTKPGDKAAADELRRAAGQMQSASGDLKRQDAGAAAANAGKAADGLRQMEERMRTGSTTARQRAAGDLQLEAQQVAQGQRRIAGERARIEKQAGGGAADARRRLAADKAALADRVDRLQRSAGALGRETAGPEGRPYSDAARQIEAEKIAERMRRTADDLGNGAESRPTQEGSAASGSPSGGGDQKVEQELARALDGVVDTLGGAQGEARKLTGALDRTREMRDRLDKLAREVKEAEARVQAGNGGRGGRDGQGPGAGNGDVHGGRGGRSGQGSEGTEGSPSSAREQLERSRQEYARELERSRDALGNRGGGNARGGEGGTPETHEFSRSSPGTEAYKQDFSGWEALRREVDLAIEQQEASIAARLKQVQPADRLSAGESQRVPEDYQRLVSRYFEALAKARK
jgi:hypothetical protein